MRTPRYKYVNVSSFIHSLNPISKAIWLICVSILSFILPDPLLIGILFLSVLLVGVLANLGARRLISAMRSLSPLLLFLCFSPSFMLLPGIQELSQSSSLIFLFLEGIKYGLTLAFRIATMIYSTVIFLMTTKMKDFVYSMAKIGVPYRYAYMVIIVFRLIPTFESEMERIRHAQMARGLGLEKTGLFKKYRNYIKYTLRPLLISSLRRGIALAISMDSACFGIFKKRTYIDEIKLSSRDIAFSIAVTLITVSICFAIFTGMLPTIFNLSEKIQKMLFPSG